MHRLNKLMSNKKHLASVHIDRIAIQHETHFYLKNYLAKETLPEQVIRDVFQLSVSHYSEVRTTAQELLFKIDNRVMDVSQNIIVPMIQKCLVKSPEISHQQFKVILK
jgi:proteasome activator subunit 4